MNLVNMAILVIQVNLVICVSVVILTNIVILVTQFTLVIMVFLVNRVGKNTLHPFLFGFWDLCEILSFLTFYVGQMWDCMSDLCWKISTEMWDKCGFWEKVKLKQIVRDSLCGMNVGLVCVLPCWRCGVNVGFSLTAFWNGLSKKYIISFLST